MLTQESFLESYTISNECANIWGSDWFVVTNPSGSTEDLGRSAAESLCYRRDRKDAT
jgi:hypothetical protein